MSETKLCKYLSSFCRKMLTVTTRPRYTTSVLSYSFPSVLNLPLRRTVYSVLSWLPSRFCVMQSRHKN